MGHFYDDLAAGCNKYYGDASDKFASDVRDMTPTVEKLSEHKHVIMNYAKEEFHTVKAAIFNIVDSLIDAQRAIESVESYFEGRMDAMKKRLGADAWKF
jgi:hypothetical protein